jgi:pSer/pThr/pTyr-binding forkhead associated (FHA) protein
VIADSWGNLLRFLPAIPLYLFLGALLVTLWRDRESVKSSTRRIPAAQLREQVDGQGASYKLEEVNLIGRAADNTIRLADSAVSAYHAKLSFQAGQWWLEDLGSRNGTRVNQLRLEEPLVVTHGDVIHLGGVSLVLSPGEPAAAGPEK